MMPRLTIKKQDYFRLREQPLAGSNLHNWFQLLCENRFQVDLPFIPRALYVTLMIAFLTPFRCIEQRSLAESLKSVKIKDPLFIIGHFRSGTTFLHYLLGNDSQLGYVSTFETMTPSMMIAHEDFFKNMVMDRLPSKRPMDDLEMHANLPYEEEYAVANLSLFSFYHGWYFPKNWKSYFDRFVLFSNVSEKKINQWKETYTYFLRKISLKNKGKRILLKNPINTGRIKRLLDLFPDAKFIHIYRNPYEVYLSTWKLYQSILPLFSFQHISSTTIDENILYTYQRLYESFLSQKHLIPKENLIEFNYTDFIADPLFYLQKSYETLALPGFSAAKSAFESYREKHRNYKASKYDFSSELKNKVSKRWGFMFDAYDFGLKD